ncbi:MAG: MmgE/PrpD family protein [Syntrophales bacterium]|nr:MmgE/PrpD family protein [Syntrophales bacterium]
MNKIWKVSVVIVGILFLFNGIAVAELNAANEAKWTPPPLTTPDQDPAGDLARFIVSTKYEDLPANVVDIAKKAMFDTLACTIAGSGWEASPQVAELAAEWGGNPQASIFMYGGKVSLPTAAFAFGCMARAIDMGDVHDIYPSHVTEWIVPALLTVAEWKGDLTGKELITAYAVGAETMVRVLAGSNLSTPRARECAPGEYPAIFGIVASVAKILDCDVEETWNAMGIGWSMSSYTEMQKYAEGTQVPRVQHSFRVQDGIQAVLLAQKKVTGPKGIFLGVPSGMFRFQFRCDTTPELISKGLGEKWLFADGLALKPYSSCKYTHSAIDGTIELVKKHNIDYRDIKSIHCTISTPAAMVIQPHEAKWNPTTVGAAMFSLPYTVATAAIKGNLFLDAYAAEEMARTDKRELMKKITAVIDPKVPEFRGFTVEITLKDGTKFSTLNEYVLGIFPQKPMSWDDLHKKYQLCIPYAARELEASRYEKVEKMFLSLENVANVGTILPTLAK